MKASLNNDTACALGLDLTPRKAEELFQAGLCRSAWKYYAPKIKREIYISLFSHHSFSLKCLVGKVSHAQNLSLVRKPLVHTLFPAPTEPKTHRSLASSSSFWTWKEWKKAAFQTSAVLPMNSLSYLTLLKIKKWEKALRVRGQDAEARARTRSNMQHTCVCVPANPMAFAERCSFWKTLLLPVGKQHNQPLMSSFLRP